jgi:hypothetical protein
MPQPLPSVLRDVFHDLAKTIVVGNPPSGFLLVLFRDEKLLDVSASTADQVERDVLLSLRTAAVGFPADSLPDREVRMQDRLVGDEAGHLRAPGSLLGSHLSAFHESSI